MRHQNTTRRGVLLLVILGLLAMFAMVAVAFVVLTNFYKQTGERNRRVDEAADPPDRQLDQAMRVVVRGSVNPASAIHSQSLLEKIYGHETLGPLQMGNLQPVTSGSNNGSQLWEFPAPAAAPPIFPDAVHRIGAVLTMLTGKAAGLSTRIVGVDPRDLGNTGGSVRMQFMAFEGGANFTPQAGDLYIISSVPYSGMGFGYNTGSLALDATTSVGGQNCPLALVPFYTDTTGNPRMDNWSPKDGNLKSSDPANWNPPGGANCGYTAPDYQDPLLAFQIPYAGRIVTPLPSLHRPELMAYWAQKTSVSSPQNQQSWGQSQLPLLRAIMARPNWIDHPNFTGNPGYFNPVWDGKTPGTGPNGLPYSWDVDNAGSGVPDSVWVDLGFPVRYTAEGKAYKPLFAILCLDLDGRLNVNAHGMLVQANLPQGTCNYYQNPQTCQQLAPVNPAGNNPLRQPEIPLGPMNAVGVVLAPSASAATVVLNASINMPAGQSYPRGQGYGPAEVNLLPLFTDNSGTCYMQQYQNLLVGSNANALFPNGLNGRYGELGLASGTIPQPGMANQLWPDTFNKWWDYQGNNPTNANNPNNPSSWYWYWSYRMAAPGNSYFWVDAYGTPPDPQGYGAVALDAAGRPLWMSMGTTCINTPYDLNLSRNAPHAVDYSPPGSTPANIKGPVDDPFGPAELEALLRRFDRDAPTLPKRLSALTSTDGTPANSLLTQYHPLAVTTESQSVPTPGLAMPPAIQAAMKAAGIDRPRHIVDLLKAAGVQQQYWATLLPPEMLAGLKLNLNRPMSDWAASSPANPNPSQSPNWFQLYSKPGNSPDWSSGSGFTLAPTGGSLQSDPTLANQAWPEPVLARQLQARYLYVLAMLLWQPNGAMQAFSEPGLQGNTTAQQQLTQRRIAQWAINVVTFSTPDSTMVPFKYPIVPGGSGPWVGPQYIQQVVTNNSTGWLRDNKIDSTTSDAAGSFGVVWGAKPPELLLTETLAFHDRRVADTAWNDSTLPAAQKKKRLDWVQLKDSQGNPKYYFTLVDEALTSHAGTNITPRLDQPRIPQGSAFIEVFCPRHPRLAAAPTDLYAAVNDPLASGGGGASVWSLDLGQLAGAPPGQPNKGQASLDGFVYPVWRIVISDSRTNPNDDVGSQPPIGSGQIYQHPDTCSLEPEQVHTVPSTGPFSGLQVSPPGAFSLLPNNTGVPNVTIERIVWFTTQSPVQQGAPGGSMALDGDRVYYNRTNAQAGQPVPVPLPAGRYAVVGPRNVTYIGTMGTPAANDGPPLGTPSLQQIVLVPPAASTFGVTPTSGTLPDVYTPAKQQIQQPVGIVVAGGGGQGASWPNAGTSIAPAPWSNQQQTCPNGIGLSISEPLFSSGYYPEPSNTAGSADVNGKWEWYGDPNMGSGQGAGGGLFRDPPLESAANTDPTAQNYPLVKDQIILKAGSGSSPPSPFATGTTFFYKTVFLQRLANPSAPYDPINNPYRTVDWMPIDLTVFNGEDSKTKQQWALDCQNPPPNNAPDGTTQQSPVDPGDLKSALIPSNYQPWDPDDPSYGDPTHLYLSSRQRGTATNFADVHYSGNVTCNIWAQISDLPLKSIPSQAPPPTGQTIRFAFDLQHTLGYLNSPFWNVQQPIPQIVPLPPQMQAQMQTQPFWITAASNISNAYIGDPLSGASGTPGSSAYPWPWLTWNGRPYINEMELLLVPASHPGRLLWEFGFVNSAGPVNNGPFVDPSSLQMVAYPHLADFFQSELLQNPTGTAAMELHRLLEFVGVPSRFDCAQTQINPNNAIGNPGNHSFHPPFNRVSNYRDPGPINLNTISSPEVLQGLLNYFPGMTFSSGTANTAPPSGTPPPFWCNFVRSRRGYWQQNAATTAGGDQYDPWDVATINNNFPTPTRFLNPFRSPSSAAMTASLLPSASGWIVMPQKEADATLLRGDPANPQRPLFEADDPLMAASMPQGQNYQMPLYYDYNRNAFFRYQELSRLANCVTTRSNVFAVWITVGYFEVQPNPFTNPPGQADAGHPDGWTLGQELGSDTGKIERHRAFYIFDRSIPVGFIRGRDVNQDNALLLRRFIE